MADVSTGALMVRLLISMVAVVSLMLIVAKLLRRAGGGAGLLGMGGRTKVTTIDVSAVRSLTKAASVAVVRVAGRELVLGVTDSEVTLLHSAIEPRDPIEVRQDVRELEPVDDDATASEPAALPAHLRTHLRHALRGRENAPRTPHHAPTAAARTAAADPGRPRHPDAGDAGSSAWTDALELLRERTIRR